MSPERWEEIKEMIVKKFPVEYQGVEDNEDMVGTMEVLECEGPIGTIRLEYITRPRDAGNKTGGAYGKRVHDSERDDDEPVSSVMHSLNIFVWNEEENDWMTVSPDLLAQL